MRTQILVERDITGLLERAYEVARAQHGLQHRNGIARIGAHVAAAEVGRVEEGRAAGEGEPDSIPVAQFALEEACDRRLRQMVGHPRHRDDPSGRNESWRLAPEIASFRPCPS